MTDVQEPEKNELKRVREDGEGDENEMDVNVLQWWDFGEEVEADAEEKAIQQVELEEHIEFVSISETRIPPLLPSPPLLLLSIRCRSCNQRYHHYHRTRYYSYNRY